MLNENALFDAGATALADTLATNSTLTSLEVPPPPSTPFSHSSHNQVNVASPAYHLVQLRDNSISEDGILALTDAVQTNTVLVDLNVKLNQPGLRGEIALFKLLKVHQHSPPPHFFFSCTQHTTHSCTTPFPRLSLDPISS
jgi:hypothetical protein